MNMQRPIPTSPASTRLSLLAVLVASLPWAGAATLQVDSFDLPGTTDGQTSFESVTFRRAFDVRPVVIVTPTMEGTDPAGLRVRNVTTTGFEVAQVEPPDAPGEHSAMNDIAYLAMEPGTVQLGDREVLHAGRVSTSTTVQYSEAFGGNAGGYDSVTFDYQLPASDPAVLTGLQTMNNESGAPPGEPSTPWMQTAVESGSINGDGFSVAIERAEVNDGSSISTNEEIGYIAVSEASPSLELEGGTVYMDAFHSPEDIQGWDDSTQGNAISFNSSDFTSAPLVIAAQSWRDGANGGWVRRGDVTASSVRLTIDEDTYYDDERNHTTEKASVVAFSEAFDATSGEFVRQPASMNEAILRYSFDAETGGIVQDLSPNDHDGTLTGNATLTTGGGGISGEAISLEGNNDYLLVGDVDELDFRDQMSVSMWFRRTTSSGSSNETNHQVSDVLIAQSSDNTNDNFELGTEDEAIEVYLDTVGQDGPTESVSASIENDTWHHVVLVYDEGETNEMKLFVDDTLVRQDSQWGDFLDDSGDAQLTLGIARPDRADPWGDFNGFIDEAQIFPWALTDTDVSYLFNNPGGSIVIPEPASWVLLALLAPLLVRRRY